MPTSRTLARPPLKTRPIRHWTNLPIAPAAPEERDQVEVRKARVVPAHKFIFCALAVVISPIVFIITIATIKHTAGLGLLLNFATWGFTKYATNRHDACSECRGKVANKASICPHCHARF